MATSKKSEMAETFKARLLAAGVDAKVADARATKYAALVADGDMSDGEANGALASLIGAAQDEAAKAAREAADASKAAIQPGMDALNAWLAKYTDAVKAHLPYAISVALSPEGAPLASIVTKGRGGPSGAKAAPLPTDAVVGQTFNLEVNGWTFSGKLIDSDTIDIGTIRDASGKAHKPAEMVDDSGTVASKGSPTTTALVARKLATGAKAMVHETGKRAGKRWTVNGRDAWGINDALRAAGIVAPSASPASGNGNGPAPEAPPAPSKRAAKRAARESGKVHAK